MQLPQRYIRRVTLQTRATLLALIAAGIPLTILSLAWTAKYMVSPVQGVISTVNTAFFTQAHFDVEPVAVQNAYATFTYPRGMSAAPAVRPSGSTLAVYNWMHPDIQTWRLAVSVMSVPSGSLSDNNAYLFRARYPNRFSESELTVQGRSVTVMTDKTSSGFSKVGFLRHGQYQAVVSLYGDDQYGISDLETAFAQVLGSWQWRQS